MAENPVAQNVGVFESLLHALTLVALGLLVPSAGVAMLLARGRHASHSAGADRSGRVAVAAAAAAAAGGTAAWFLGSGPAAIGLAAVLLGVPVVVWAFLAPWWPVRAVVAWAMLVTGSVGAVGLAAARALESAEPWTAVPVTAFGAGLLVLVLERLNGPFRRMLGIRAGIRRAVRTPVYLRPALLRPGLALAVFFAALAAGGLTGVAPRPGDGRYPSIGAGPAPGRGDGAAAELDGADVRPVSAESATPAEAAAALGASQDGFGTGAAGRGTDGLSLAAATRNGTDAGTRTRTSSTGGGEEDGGPVANAPVPDGGDTGDTVDNAVRHVNDTVETVRKKVEETTGPIPTGGGQEPTGSTVEQTVEPVRSVVEQTVEPVVSDPVGQVTGTVTDTTGVSLP